MQQVVFEKPYAFIPPHRGDWWPSFIQLFRLNDFYLRRYHGVAHCEIRRVDRLQASFAAGHGVMLTPNHCRPADPIVLGFLARKARCLVWAMASWHLFQQHWFTGWAINKMGAFSIYREGVDRQAIDTAIEVLADAKRPLILFPEGSVTRTNDRLHALLDGVSFIARAAAKRRAKHGGGKIVVHPVAVKYFFEGNLERACTPVLREIEQRLSWYPHEDLSLMERINKVGGALLALKEIEFFGKPQSGRMHDRLHGLIDRLLGPLEEEWIGARKEGPVVPRVKGLRMAILPEMVRGEVTPAERARRWRQLAEIYLAQQVSCYSPDYLVKYPSVDRILETVERYEEDLTDRVRVHGPFRVVLDVGEAIPVSTERDRAATVDPLLQQISERLQGQLDALAKESPLYEGSGVRVQGSGAAS